MRHVSCDTLRKRSIPNQSVSHKQIFVIVFKRDSDSVSARTNGAHVMSKERREDQQVASIDLEEVAKAGAPKEDIAYRIEEGKRIKELRRTLARRRLVRLRLVVILGIGVLGAGGYSGYWIYTRHAAKTSNPPALAAEFSFHVVEAMVLENYKMRKAAITIPAVGDLDAVAYDFDSHRFLKGKAVLDDQEALKKTLVELREELQNSWILVFAGASFEGTSALNLGLCRQRVNAVARMMASDIGISNARYWAIRAGEYKQKGTSLSEKDEDRLAAEMGEKALAEQRRLIVIAIKAHNPVVEGDANRTMSVLVKSFYDQEFLPVNYDYSRTEPAPLLVPEH
jgi:hypothetical protein